MLKCRVLFLCATGGLHGSMAEAILNWIDSEHFEATSAGIICGRLHPLIPEVLKEIGIDVEQKAPESLEQLPDEQFQYVITLGERAPSYDRNFPGAEIVHWRFDHPLGLANDLEKQLRGFRIVRDQIVQRLRLFVLVHARPRAAGTSLSRVQKVG
ncbi:MAG TPA: hypothetical protein VKN18_09745 [Blastocatellia bacterium]|nr:hypothetical protein [Blastocatellia bacterium]